MDDPSKDLEDASVGGDREVTERRTQEIRQEIEQTREEMSETIEAIQEKLRPGNIVSAATERVKTSATEGVKHMADTVRSTAQQAMEQTRYAAQDFTRGDGTSRMPAAVIGLGVAWWLIDRYRTSAGRGIHYYRNRELGRRYPVSGYDGRDDYSETAGGFDVRAGDETTPVGRYRPRVTDTSRPSSAGMGESASHAREAAMRTGRHARHQFQDLVERNPLMVGAAAVLVGAGPDARVSTS